MIRERLAGYQQCQLAKCDREFFYTTIKLKIQVVTARRMKKILKILEPITLPITISASLLRAATIEAINSGKEVPGPTIANDNNANN